MLQLSIMRDFRYQVSCGSSSNWQTDKPFGVTCKFFTKSSATPRNTCESVISAPVTPYATDPVTVTGWTSVVICEAPESFTWNTSRAAPHCYLHTNVLYCDSPGSSVFNPSITSTHLSHLYLSLPHPHRERGGGGSGISHENHLSEWRKETHPPQSFWRTHKRMLYSPCDKVFHPPYSVDPK